jgi:prepilin-type N-terminal cleavage/methylation domain-containing protein/prepilin-type processing-associated H-X9-DG protein
MKRRAGFTLIELLVVVAIISVLVGFLLPAIISARRFARRIQCENNLHQHGLALGQYASSHRVFPPGVVQVKGPISSRPRGYHVGWVVQILPFIEQGNILRHTDLRRGVYDRVNTTALDTRLDVFICPEATGPGPIHYAGCHHDVEAPIDANNHGVLYLNSHVGYDDITDGPAYTILLGETRGGAMFGWASGTRDTLRNTGWPINAPEPAPVMSKLPAAMPAKDRADFEDLIGLGLGTFPPSFVGGFSSGHGLGANFLFCDGSARFVRQSIEPRVYRCLGHRSDGEIISGEQY